jgi:hypothetical protein
MKTTLVASLCASMLFACSENSIYGKHEHIVQQKEADASAHKILDEFNDMQISGRFQISNELGKDEVKIYAYEVNQLKDGIYYFQVMIKNNSTYPLHMMMDQIVLVDQHSNEYKAGLIDYELLEVIEPNDVVSGIIGFERFDTLEPSFLRIKKNQKR